MPDTARVYTDDHLRSLFQFVGGDFERFLDLKRWLDGLDAGCEPRMDSLDSFYAYKGAKENA